MLMKKFGIILSLFVVASLSTWAQGAKSIRITEVMTNNQKSIVDEFGMHKAWVELSNTSFTTYNVRGMFLTTDRRVLDKKMSPEERRKFMVALPNNDVRTSLAGKKSLLVYDRYYWAKGREYFTQQGKSEYSQILNAETGPFQFTLSLWPSKELAEDYHASSNWIALYDGNAVDLIDSISIPMVEG